MRKAFILAFGVGALVACDGEVDEPAPGDGGGPATGDATYDDASTEPDGSPREAEPVEPGTEMTVEVRVEGSGTLSGLEPECALEQTAGGFSGLYAGEATVDENGVYAASLAEGTFTTPSGACLIPDLEIGSFTSVVVHAEIENTQENCDTYCQGHARAEAETACEGDADQVSCRSEAEAEAMATCETECTTETRRIVAETSLTVEQVAAVNASGLTGATIGEVQADLTFDRIE